MRIRMPFAGAFLGLVLLAAYASLNLQLTAYVNKQVLHVTTFFALTVLFYWVVDTSRRRALHMSIVTCTCAFGVGSEFAQSFLPSNRDFDLLDIAANVAGSLAAAALCSWYHKRMLERKRQRKNYTAVPGEDDADVELGEGHENGTTDQPDGARTLEQEVDNWDENAPDDWEDEGHVQPVLTNAVDKTKVPEPAGNGDAKKD